MVSRFASYILEFETKASLMTANSAISAPTFKPLVEEVIIFDSNRNPKQVAIKDGKIEEILENSLRKSLTKHATNNETL